eukprot:gene7199-9665_t
MELIQQIAKYAIRLAILHLIVTLVQYLWRRVQGGFLALPRNVRAIVLTGFIRVIRSHVDGFWTWFQWKYWLTWPYAKAQDGCQVLEGVKDIRWDQYGQHPKEMVHVLSPEREYTSCCSGKPVNAKASTVVYFHGGGFVFASSSVLIHSVTCFCRQGFSVYSFDYPLAPDNRFPAALISTLRAFEWLHSQEHIQCIMLLGDSAGANLVSMAATMVLNRHLLDKFSSATNHPEMMQWNFPKIESMACLYGLLDQHSWRGRSLKQISPLENFMAIGGIAGALELYESLEGSFGNRLSLMDIMPDTKYFPRTLFIGGSQDPLVYSTLVVHERLYAKNFDVHCKIFPARHGFFGFPPQWTLGAWLEGAAPTCQLLCNFFKQSPETHKGECSVTGDGLSCCEAHKGDFGIHALKAYDRHFDGEEGQGPHLFLHPYTGL